MGVAGLNYYERHLGDFAKDTAHLNQGQIGAYNLLLDFYYASEMPLPLDPAELYEIGRARDVASRINVDKVVARFFEKTPQGYTQKRVEKEVKRYREKQAQARISAELSVRARQKSGDYIVERTLSERSTDAEPALNERSALQYPVTSNQTKNTYPPEFEVFWKQWPAHWRKCDKQATLKRWQLAMTDGATPAEVIAGVERWKRTDDWQKDSGNFIPAPEVWLNKRRWVAHDGATLKPKARDRVLDGAL